MKNSKEVDWNEAPEGSTHYNGELKCSWLKETPHSFYNNGFWDEYILDWEVHFSNAIKRPQEFPIVVYEPEQQGHIHAENMALFAEDAKTHAEPWKLWECRAKNGTWCDCLSNPRWVATKEYRRKLQTRIVHGVELPIFEFTPKVGEKFYTANVGLPEFFEEGYRSPKGFTYTQRMIERGLLYPFTEEGKQAAILHAKTMLGTGNLSTKSQ